MLLRNIITKDWGWKTFSLALAVAIWFIVKPISTGKSSIADKSEVTTTNTFNEISLLVMSSTADVHEFKVKPEAVQVIISGKSEIVGSLAHRDIHAMVDLTGVEPVGSPKRRVEVSVPVGITVVSISPGEVSITPPNEKAGNPNP